MKNRYRILLWISLPLGLILSWMFATGFTGNFAYWPQRYSEEKKLALWSQNTHTITMYDTRNWEITDAELEGLPNGQIDPAVFSLALAASEYRWGFPRGRGYLVVGTTKDGNKDKMVLHLNGAFRYPDSWRGYFALPDDQRQRELYDEVLRVMNHPSRAGFDGQWKAQPSDAENSE